MKYFSFLIVLFFFYNVAFAQANADSSLQTKETKTTQRPRQVVYVLAGGAAPFFSVMYDRRIFKTPNGLGFAVGFGGYFDENNSLRSMPITINYLFGKETHFLELGISTSYVNGPTKLFVGEATYDKFIFIGTIGYRYQTAKGFFGNIGFDPLHTGKKYYNSGHIGIGYSF
jgi:hypothetical protein